LTAPGKRFYKPESQKGKNKTAFKKKQKPAEAPTKP